MSQQFLYPLVQQGITRNFGLSFKEYPKKWSLLFNVDPTSKRVIDVQGYTSFGLPQRRSPGEPIAQDSLTIDFPKRYVVDSYALGTSVADEDMDDDQYGFLNRYIPGAGGEFGKAAAVLLEYATAAFFGTLGFSTGTTVYGMSDGRSLFNTAHPVSASNPNTIANRPTADVDLSIASMQAASLALRYQKASNNLQFIDNPVRRLVVNPNQEYIAKQILNQTMEFRTFDNNTNYLKDENIQIVSWPYFQRSGINGAATNAYNTWFIQGDSHSAHFYMRQPWKMRTDFDTNTNSNIFAGTMRFGFGVDGFRGFYGSLGS